MSDLINRQAAIDAIEEIRSCIWDVDIPSPTVPEYIEHHKQMQELMDRCDTLRRNLENLPSAERKRGEWKETTESIGWEEVSCAECSVCGETFVLGDYTMDDIKLGFNYCPNCGSYNNG